MASAFPPDDDDYTGKRNLDECESEFTEEQIIALREFIVTNERPSPSEISNLAEEIGLTFDKVERWFSYKRVHIYMTMPFTWHRSGASTSNAPSEDSQRPTSTDRPISPVSLRCPVLIAMLQSDPLIIRPPGCFGGAFDANTSEASAATYGEVVSSSQIYQPEASDELPNPLFYPPETRDEEPNLHGYQPETRGELTITIQLDSCSLQRDRDNDMAPHSSTSPNGSTYPHTGDSFSSTQHPQDCVCSSSHSPTIAINTSPTKRARFSASGDCSQPNFPSTSGELARRTYEPSSSVDEEDNSEVSSTRHSPDNPEDDANKVVDDDEDTLDGNQH